ncbi:hydrogenase expression/formation protein [Ideonella livida]|uniref:Hydrogenase expression/formation protein n=1 Tax=Ideonella livida TaxID=2707176 RepID=A0A7C9PER8_9BURK|nr:hydrogenase expression/formation protein [Ideonella livida]NDY89808.1 hydrogenase expression/formation protein [Ideonella livida]
MNPDFAAKPFPIPVVALGAGSQPTEEGLEVLQMPSGMATYRAPVLPEPEDLAGHDGAVGVLRQALAHLHQAVAGQPVSAIDLGGLAPADLQLVNQVLGEGEVSAQVLRRPGDMAGGAQVRVQESVFAGVWRVVLQADDGRQHDWIEIGPVPEVLVHAAQEDGRHAPAPLPLPPGVLNARSVLTELAAHRQTWRAGQPAEVVNLSLLPLAPEDIAYLDAQIGTGRVLILSRGYGNCRITNACVPHTWRVVYYNSQDTVILNAVEVVRIPEVACAAPEDLADSAERLHEVLAWVEQG